jgi:hypothetical protein
MSFDASDLIPVVYAQANTSVLVDGVTIRGFMDGTPITCTFDGGEIEKTEGCDGPGLNMARRQGGTIKFSVRENSPSVPFMLALINTQYIADTALPINVTVISGGGRVFDLFNCLVQQPGELSTGDKKVGGIEFTIVGTTFIGA